MQARNGLIALEVAERSVAVDVAPAILRLLSGSSRRLSRDAPPQRPPEGWSVVSEGLVAGRMREVECRAEGDHFRVNIADVESFAVSTDGTRVERVGGDRAAAGDAVDDALLGPPLILALALQSAFCLHAAAVAIQGRVAAFLGASGAGKSTLARSLAGGGDDVVLVADDVLPWETDGGAVSVLPHFPQPKLAPSVQPCLSLPGRLPLGAAFVLEAGGGGVDEVLSEPLGPAAAATAWLRHSMAASLFPPALLEHHLQACARAVEGVRTFALRYPYTVETTAKVAACVARRVVRS